MHIGAIGRSEKSGILEIDAQISALSFEIWHDIHFLHTQQAMQRSTVDSIYVYRERDDAKFVRDE